MLRRTYIGTSIPVLDTDGGGSGRGGGVAEGPVFVAVSLASFHSIFLVLATKTEFNLLCTASVAARNIGTLGRCGKVAWRLLKAETVFAQLLEVDAGAYSKALSGGRNNCTMREEISTAQTDA